MGGLLESLNPGAGVSGEANVRQLADQYIRDDDEHSHKVPTDFHVIEC